MNFCSYGLFHWTETSNLQRFLKVNRKRNMVDLPRQAPTSQRQKKSLNSRAIGKELKERSPAQERKSGLWVDEVLDPWNFGRWGLMWLCWHYQSLATPQRAALCDKRHSPTQKRQLGGLLSNSPWQWFVLWSTDLSVCRG